MEKVQSSIDLNPLKAENNTRIICQATNKISNVTKTEVILYVQYPPSKPYFHFLPRNNLAKGGKLLAHKLIIEERSNFTVMCRSDGDPPPTCRWNITNDKTKYPYLTFANITKNDKGIYRCVAENFIQRNFPKYERKKNKSTDLEIDVQYQSRIVKFYVTEFEKLDHSEATENETVSFNCKVDCNPSSSIAISFKNKELGHNESTQGLVLPHKVISCFDDGEYTCSAHNRYNSEPCLEELTLRVRCTPLLSPDFDLRANITSTQNMTVTFSFKTIAFPTPDFQWFKFSGSSWYTLTNNRRFHIKRNGLYSILTISKIAADDFGIYKLRIDNKVGVLEQLYFLKANDSLTVSTKLTIDLKYFIYTLGGIIFIVALLVGTYFIFKRQKQQCTKAAFDQNVSIEVHEAENIYQNMPINRTNKMRETKYVCHYKKPVVYKIQENTTEVRESGISLNLQEFDNIMLEPPKYCNTQHTIDNLEHIKISEILDYILNQTDESVSAEFQKIPTVFQLPCSSAHNPKNLSQNRYRDVVPYDNTRVVIDNQPEFYINASYIDGYNIPNEYIACLGIL
ncbi:hemicentin-1-like [Ruditapes philippinarum]|uniref:hemicentin-1-like n=1 Tax=Ruditapes philippinarum TaxID=129788 RepID=UPI00295A8AB3|nr:hemicentin-1-like [Ruditapes philippinarum]